MSEAVKVRRKYDSEGRVRRAQERRQQVLDAAETAFLAQGYAATTVAGIAASAGVSVEMIYKAFGPKAGLVRELWLRGLGGRGTTPAPLRSDAFAESAADAESLIRHWSGLIEEVAPRGAPLALLVAAAAAADPEMADLRAEIEEERRARMRVNAERLAERGWLRDGVTVERAADIMWSMLSAHLYDSLVLRAGWSAREYADFIRTTLVAALT